MNGNRNKKIIIYGTGQYGCRIATIALSKGYDIIGAYNRAGIKVGQDLGRVAGLNYDLGVIIQDCDKVDYSAVKADIAVVAMTNVLAQNLPAYRQLLSAGMNVICHGSESYFPQGSNSTIASEIDALAKQHGVTFTGAGIWDMSRIWSGILATAPCTTLHSLTHCSLTNLSIQAESLAQAMQVGAGLSIDEFYAKGLDKSPIAGSYKTVPQHVLHALGFSISNTTFSVEPLSLNYTIHDEKLGVFPAGICLGSRAKVLVSTDEGVTASADIDVRICEPNEVEYMSWEIDGTPSNKVIMERRETDFATASCLFNRINDVVAARPGVVLLSELGPMKGSFHYD